MQKAPSPVGSGLSNADIVGMTCNSILHIDLFAARYSLPMAKVFEVGSCIEQNIPIAIEQRPREAL